MTKWLVALAAIWLVWTLLRKPATPRPRKVSRVAPDAIAVQEARKLLDVRDDADEQQIREAHRRKITAAHPDRGGSAELARQVNAARDLLLRRRT